MIALQNKLFSSKTENIKTCNKFLSRKYNNFVLSPYPEFERFKAYYKAVRDSAGKSDEEVEKEIRRLLEALMAEGIYYIPYNMYKTYHYHGKMITCLDPTAGGLPEKIDNYIDGIIWCIKQNKIPKPHTNDKYLFHFAMTDESNFETYSEIYENTYNKLKNQNHKYYEECNKKLIWKLYNRFFKLIEKQY